MGAWLLKPVYQVCLDHFRTVSDCEPAEDELAANAVELEQIGPAAREAALELPDGQRALAIPSLF